VLIKNYQNTTILKKLVKTGFIFELVFFSEFMYGQNNWPKIYLDETDAPGVVSNRNR